MSVIKNHGSLLVTKTTTSTHHQSWNLKYLILGLCQEYKCLKEATKNFSFLRFSFWFLEDKTPWSYQKTNGDEFGAAPINKGLPKQMIEYLENQ